MYRGCAYSAHAYSAHFAIFAHVFSGFYTLFRKNYNLIIIHILNLDTDKLFDFLEN